jgi:hypothetical protein
MEDARRAVNIGGVAQQRRMRGGIIFFTLASLGTVLMINFGLPTWTRIFLVVPYGVSVMLMTMALFKT